MVATSGCLIAQPANRADKRIYALRGVTATVESIPLIVASILQKLAEGIDGLVLDVRSAAGSCRTIAAKASWRLVRGFALLASVWWPITAMDSPLGRSVGNAPETRAIELLRGHGLPICSDHALGAEMLRSLAWSRTGEKP